MERKRKREKSMFKNHNTFEKYGFLVKRFFLFCFYQILQ